jgi:XTP/dITP diphosphohydrolase
MNILFASQNIGKITEIKKFFKDSKYQLVTLSDHQLLEDLNISSASNLIVAETGKTLQDNALIKAEAFYKLSKMPCLADDSGLILEAFPNFPGVDSKRWFNGTDQERNLALLKKLKGQKNRRAKFQTVLCLYYFKKEKPLFFVGEVFGYIAEEARGKTGFGYDPLFIPDGYEKSFAELGLEVKNKISHRAKAWQSLANYLEKN